MFNTLRSFLAGATVVSAVALTATVPAFSAPKPDAPEIAVARPKSVVIRAQAKKTAKRTRVIVRRAERPAPAGLQAVAIDEPDPQTGTISVVTEKNEFATIATGAGTRFARGNQAASLGNIHTGTVLRCQGGWDRDGFQYVATRVSLGGMKKDTDVIARVNAACENIATARKGGGYGKSLVAMVPPASAPRAVSLDRQSAQAAAPVAVPVDDTTPRKAPELPYIPALSPASVPSPEGAPRVP